MSSYEESSDHRTYTITGVVNGNVLIHAICPLITYSITRNITNGTYSGSTTIAQGGTAQVQIIPNQYFICPTEITVNGVVGTSGSTGVTWTYNSETGIISLSNPSGNVTITCACTRNQATVTFANTTNYTITDQQGQAITPPYIIDIGGTFTFAITANSGYSVADVSSNMMTISNASILYYTSNLDYTKAYVSINNATDNVTITLNDIVAYSVAGIITNGTMSGGYIAPYSDAISYFSITPNSGYSYPTTVSVNNAILASYDPSDGTGAIRNPSGNVTIMATCMMRLSAPTVAQANDNLTITKGDNNTTSFDIYDGDTYKLNVALASSSSTTAVITISSLNLSVGQHSLRAKAKAQGYLDSDFSNSVTYDKYGKCDTPLAQINSDGHTFVFTAVAYASSYTLYVDGSIVQTGIVPPPTSFDLSTLTLSIGAHSVQIQAIGSGYYTNSDLSTSVQYTRTQQLATPQASIMTSWLSWGAITNAYTYAIYADGIQVTTTTTTTILLSSLGLSAGTHSLQVQALATGYYTASELSSAVQYTVVAPTLATPSIALDGTDLLITDNDGNATSFDLYNGNTFVSNIAKNEEGV